jgi:hypothetical protein
MTSNRGRTETATTTTQPASRTPHRWQRMKYLLVLLGTFASYGLGLYSHPLLFKTSEAGATENSFSPTQESTVDEPVSVPGPPDLSVTQAYQALADEVETLSDGDYDTPELVAKLAALEQEVRELRVLNPYYLFQEIQAEVIPSGVPANYGTDLSVSFDEVQASIDVMAKLDPTFGENPIVLTGPDLERYVRTASATACKYCCTATTLVKPDGTAACSCEHSQAMRGLAAYLITNSPDEYSDEELVGELNRWRAVFFPRQTLTEALVSRRSAGEPGIEEIMTEFPEFMPQMVGGC